MKIFNPYWQYTPIFLNPSPDDITEISKHKWDTLRVIIYDDPKHKDFRIGVADGYGNTHNSIQVAIKRHFSLRYPPFGVPLIVYHEYDKRALINAADCSRSEEEPTAKWHEFLELPEVDLIKLLCQERGLNFF